MLAKTRQLSPVFIPAATEMRDSVRTVSCAADSYDLRPALDALQLEIESRAQKGPLIVLMGEHHQMSSHILFRQALIQRLLSTSSHLAYGIECAHDFLARMIAGTPAPDPLYYKISDQDKNGQKFLKVLQSVQGFGYIFNAPVAHHNIYTFLLNSGISVSPNDLSCSELYIDNLNAYSPNQLHRRNKMIVERAINHKKRSGSEIYIQHCGMSHVAGNSKDGYLYEHSLCELFSKAGLAVLPVMMEPNSLMKIPGEAQPFLKENAFFIDGLPKDVFLSFSKGEYQFLKKMARHSGGEIEIIPEPGILKDMWLSAKLKAQIPLWAREAKKAEAKNTQDKCALSL